MCLIPAILCGGESKRLAPLGAELPPKPFHALSGGKHSLLQETALRAKTLSDESMLVIAPARYAELTRTQLNALNVNYELLLEPAPRNTAAAIAAAVQHVQAQREENATLLILPSDHVLDKIALQQAVSRGLPRSEEKKLVLFGIPPAYPSSEMGYIYVSKDDTVKGFSEKPTSFEAETLVRQGHVWNSGMFLGDIRTWHLAFEQHAPEIWQGVKEALTDSSNTNGIILGENFANVLSLPVDKAICEKATNLAMLPLYGTWNDLGNWRRIHFHLPKDEHNNALLGEHCELKSLNGCLVYNYSNITPIVGGKDEAIIRIGEQEWRRPLAA